MPKSELDARMNTFISKMDSQHSDWEFIAIFGRVSQYYFTGTMQSGVLIISKGYEPTLYVRLSYERAVGESNFGSIEKMKSYREIAAKYSAIPNNIYIDSNIVPLSTYSLFNNYFGFKSVKPVEGVLTEVRSVKSEYELELMRKSGHIHAHITSSIIPSLIEEGISEADLMASIYPLMVKAGHQATVRFGMFQSEIVIGQLGFGSNSLIPTSFDGPGGGSGLSIASPVLGSRDVELKRGDLIFCDVACGYNGYHTDKTETYTFKGAIPDYAVERHNLCVAVQDRVASMLIPGAIPSVIYREVMETLDSRLVDNFMGYGDRQVKFLGHSIGLLIDEAPAIARGFDKPLEENMVFAIEPKYGVEGVGMVGIENTFIVKSGGGEKITGDGDGLVELF